MHATVDGYMSAFQFGTPEQVGHDSQLCVGKVDM